MEGATLVILRECSGLKALFKWLLKQRFETPKLILSDINVEENETTISKFNILGGPVLSTLHRRQLVTIFLYHVIRNYRGWRYVRNLPTRGQRTWSNAWTAYRCNVLLKKLILKRGRSFYGNLHSSEVYTAYLAEYVNKKWQEHWHGEWSYARKIRLFNKKKKRQSKIDLYSMARGHIITEKRLSKLTKKQKAQHNFNNHALGFIPGFTRKLLKRLFKMRSVVAKRGQSSSALILNKSDLRVKKSKKVKKKVNEKARLAAHAARKKTKSKK